MPDRFIVIEGLDGSGKTTQIEELKIALENKRLDYKHIKFPDYNDPSSSLVKMYLAGEFGDDPCSVNAYAASAFYACDRYANFIRYWRDEYEEGKTIISDRYVSSNAIHQMVKLPKEEWDDYLGWLEDFEYNKLEIPKPDCVIFLDMPVRISQSLLSQRYNGAESKKDLHERDVDYMFKCRTAALYASDKLGWKLIPCSDNDDSPLPINEIHNKIWLAIQL